MIGSRSNARARYRLVVFCKDANDFAFNRAAWGTFFTIIQRHTGVLEHLIEKGAITNFFDIISVVSGNLISHNAIHYIHKVCTLVCFVDVNKLRDALFDYCYRSPAAGVQSARC